VTEPEKARAWRLRPRPGYPQGLTWDQLSELSGYGRSTLYWQERGQTPPGRGKSARNRKIDPFVWQRFKLVMAAVDQQLRTGEKFNWGE
jgi:hypothetical protein